MVDKSPENKLIVREQEASPEAVMFREFEHAMMDMERRMDRVVRDAFGADRDLWRFPVVQGLSLQPGPDGRLRFQPFGHVQESLDKFLAGWREPLLSYRADEDAGRIEFRAEVPGLGKEDIHLEVLPDGIRIEGESKAKAHGKAGHAKYQAVCRPGYRLEPDGAEARCDAGVLTVTCRIRPPEGAKGKAVKVQ